MIRVLGLLCILLLLCIMIVGLLTFDKIQANLDYAYVKLSNTSLKTSRDFTLAFPKRDVNSIDIGEESSLIQGSYVTVRDTFDGSRKNVAEDTKEREYELDSRELDDNIINEQDGEFLSPNDVYSFPVNGVNCDALFHGDSRAISKAIEYQSKAERYNPRLNQMPEGYLINKTKDCLNYAKENHFITKPVSREEEDFPLAFSLLVYKDIDQVERLMRVIYRPQNYYCIHVDLKAEKDFFENMKAFARCFPNVFLTEKRIDVRWGTFSVLEPELVCMEELLRYKAWEYFINLTGQEFPLQTNLDLVRIMKIFNGANNAGGAFNK